MQAVTRKRLIVALPIVAIICLASVYYFAKIRPMMRAGREQGEYSDAASRRGVSEFRFETKNGARSLNDYRGKIVLIDVWATWCAPCVASIPHLARIEEKYRKRGLEVIALSVDRGRWSDVDPFVEKRTDINYSLAVPAGETDVHFSTLIDLNPLGNVAALPTAFVIDTEGKLAGKFVGAGRYEEVESLIAKLIDERGEHSQPPEDEGWYKPAMSIEGEYATVKEAGISFVYKVDDYDRLLVKKEPKYVAEENTPPAPEESPEHFYFAFEDKRPLPALDQGPRYFFPAQSFISIIPLSDQSVSNFAAAYPNVNAAAQELRKLFGKRPGTISRGQYNLPDLPPLNASQSFVSRAQYLDFRSGSGILFLTQYSQDAEPNPINNEELTCSFQGLTNDGRFYVAARLSITHASLPAGIDFTDHIKRDKRLLYLKKDESKLNQLPEDSFKPSLKRLKELLSSISVE